MMATQAVTPGCTPQDLAALPALDPTASHYVTQSIHVLNFTESPRCRCSVDTHARLRVKTHTIPFNCSLATKSGYGMIRHHRNPVCIRDAVV